MTDTPPADVREDLPLDMRQLAGLRRVQRWRRLWAVLLSAMAALSVLVDAVTWFFAGWASVDGDVGLPPTRSAADRVNLCGILALAAAVAAAAAPLAALVISLRRGQRATRVASVLAAISLTIGFIGFVVGASVLQNPQ